MQEEKIWPPARDDEHHDMAETSKEAGRKIRDAGLDHEGERAVFAVLVHSDVPLSRAEIADRTEYREKTICWRVDALLRKGLIVEVGTRVNERGYTVKVLDVNPDYGVPGGDSR